MSFRCGPGLVPGPHVAGEVLVLALVGCLPVGASCCEYAVAVLPEADAAGAVYRVRPVAGFLHVDESLGFGLRVDGRRWCFMYGWYLELVLNRRFRLWLWRAADGG